MSSNSIFLDVDPSLVEKNLHFTSNEGDEIQKLFSETNYPSKVIKPSPGWPKSTVGSSGFAAAKVEWSGNRVEDLETVVATPVTIA